MRSPLVPLGARPRGFLRRGGLANFIAATASEAAAIALTASATLLTAAAATAVIVAVATASAAALFLFFISGGSGAATAALTGVSSTRVAGATAASVNDNAGTVPAAGERENIGGGVAGVNEKGGCCGSKKGEAGSSAPRAI